MSIATEVARAKVSQAMLNFIPEANGRFVVTDELDLFESVAWAVLDRADDDTDLDRIVNQVRVALA